MKPMELNVIEQIPGKEITFYDTSVKEENFSADKKERIRLLEYGYGIINGRDLLKWALDRMKQKYRKG